MQSLSSSHALTSSLTSLDPQKVRPWLKETVRWLRDGASSERSGFAITGKEFVPHLGPFFPRTPSRVRPPSFQIKFQQSKLTGEPFYIPVNWRILLKDPPDQTIVTSFRLRCRLQQHGGCTIALVGQLRSEVGIPTQQVVDVLRGIADPNNRNPTIFSVATSANCFEGTGTNLLDRVQSLLEAGLFGEGQIDYAHSEDLTLNRTAEERKCLTRPAVSGAARRSVPRF